MTDEGNEAQRGQVACSSSHSRARICTQVQLTLETKVLPAAQIPFGFFSSLGSMPWGRERRAGGRCRELPPGPAGTPPRPLGYSSHFPRPLNFLFWGRRDPRSQLYRWGLRSQGTGCHWTPTGDVHLPPLCQVLSQLSISPGAPCTVWETEAPGWDPA